MMGGGSGFGSTIGRMLGGGGYNPTPDQKRNVYLLMDALVRPPRFDRLFQIPDRDNVVINREDVPVNILDWTDVDVTRYSPVGAGGAESVIGCSGQASGPGLSGSSAAEWKT